MKGFLIGATSSGCGKTTITLGLLRALARRGLSVQPFKVGPDYIDTGWHQQVSGVASRNLDAFMLPEATLKALFYHHAAHSDVSVIEGVMGLFDGYGLDPHDCSSAGVACTLDCPVILIVDGKAVSTSAAATVLGFRQFDPALRLAGVIVNRVNSDGHYQLLKQAIERYTGVPVLGRVPVMSSVSLPSRHLGLVTAKEARDPALEAQWNALADALEQHLDLDALLALSELPTRAAAPLYPAELHGYGEGLTLALADDEAFNFYYPDNLELLEHAGVRIVRFSPLHDSALPDCQMIYLGGGYPELYGEQLGANSAMRSAIDAAHQRGVAIYAECGGLMYLGQALTDAAGARWPMVGVLAGESTMTHSLKRFGYCEATAKTDTLLAAATDTLRGHEFHYSDFSGGDECVFAMQKERDGVVQSRWEGGYQRGNTLASYLHVHFLQQPLMLKHWIDRARSSQ